MAVGSGAYSPGTGASWGRLCLWRSLAGLLSLPAGADVHAIEARANRATWILVTPDDDWFDDVAWDLWLIALDNGVATVLAVTDTD